MFSYTINFNGKKPEKFVSQYCYSALRNGQIKDLTDKMPTSVDLHKPIGLGRGQLVEERAFQQWLLSSSPFKNAYLRRTKLNNVAVTCHVDPHLFLGACIAAKFAWERRKSLSLWYHAVKSGSDPLTAFITAYYIIETSEHMQKFPTAHAPFNYSHFMLYNYFNMRLGNVKLAKYGVVYSQTKEADGVSIRWSKYVDQQHLATKFIDVVTGELNLLPQEWVEFGGTLTGTGTTRLLPRKEYFPALVDNIDRQINMVLFRQAPYRPEIPQE